MHLLSQLSVPQKTWTIGMGILAFFVIMYFAPGIIKGLYDVGYRTGAAIASWLN